MTGDVEKGRTVVTKARGVKRKQVPKGKPRSKNRQYLLALEPGDVRPVRVKRRSARSVKRDGVDGASGSGAKRRVGRPLGRNPDGSPKTRAGVAHLKRESFDQRMPVHVTLAFAQGVFNLRSERCWQPIREILQQASAPEAVGEFAILEFTVQGNHMHLLVEADSSTVLRKRMQGLCTRIAKAIAKVMRLRGVAPPAPVNGVPRPAKLLSDRFHSRVLHSMREASRVRKYILDNTKKHTFERVETMAAYLPTFDWKLPTRWGRDWYSSSSNSLGFELAQPRTWQCGAKRARRSTPLAQEHLRF